MARTKKQVAEKPKRKVRSTLNDVVTYEMTIHLHKHIFGRSFKDRAPHAIKSIRSFAEKRMGTKDVRIDAKLNEAIWGHGIRNVPRRMRIRLNRKRNDASDAKEKLYTYVTYVPVTGFKGLQTEVVDEEN